MKLLPIGPATALVLGTRRFASGMAAREGEDPLAGLERSQQPGPQGDAQFPRRHKYDEL
jgi:hypothetical protein